MWVLTLGFQGAFSHTPTMTAKENVYSLTIFTFLCKFMLFLSGLLD